MRGLIGYRFLRLFAGDLENRRNQQAPIFNDQTFESDVEIKVGPDCSDSEEQSVTKLSESDDIQNRVGQNKKNETKIQSEIMGGEE